MPYIYRWRQVTSISYVCCLWYGLFDKKYFRKEFCEIFLWLWMNFHLTKVKDVMDESYWRVENKHTYPYIYFLTQIIISPSHVIWKINTKWSIDVFLLLSIDLAIPVNILSSMIYFSSFLTSNSFDLDFIEDIFFVFFSEHQLNLSKYYDNSHTA